MFINESNRNAITLTPPPSHAAIGLECQYNDLDDMLTLTPSAHSETDDDTFSPEHPEHRDDNIASEAGPDDDRNGPDQANHFDQMVFFTSAQQEVAKWTARWGGLENWPDELGVLFSQAEESETVAEWTREVWQYTERGRTLREFLRTLRGDLPREMWKIRELWHQHVELVRAVERGLACLEMRCNIIRKDYFNLLGKWDPDLPVPFSPLK